MSQTTESTELDVLIDLETIRNSVLTTYTPSVCATATCRPVASGVAELTVALSSIDHCVINSPLPQKCSEILPVFVTVSSVDDDEKDV